jgi:hypothetical protein
MFRACKCEYKKITILVAYNETCKPDELVLVSKTTCPSDHYLFNKDKKKKKYTVEFDNLQNDQYEYQKYIPCHRKYHKIYSNEHKINIMCVKYGTNWNLKKNFQVLSNFYHHKRIRFGAYSLEYGHTDYSNCEKEPLLSE